MGDIQYDGFELLLLDLEVMRQESKKRQNMFMLQLLELEKQRQLNLRKAIYFASAEVERVPRIITKKNEGFWEKCVPEWTDERFHKKFRVRRPLFDKLVKDLGSVMWKETKFSHNPISVAKRIAIALTVSVGWVTDGCC